MGLRVGVLAWALDLVPANDVAHHGNQVNAAVVEKYRRRYNNQPRYFFRLRRAKLDTEKPAHREAHDHSFAPGVLQPVQALRRGMKPVLPGEVRQLFRSEEH